MLWSEKYAPVDLNETILHPSISELLSKLSNSKNLPHLLFYGPRGAGKNTLVRCFLSELYGKGALKVRRVSKEIKVNNKVVEFSTVSSNYHIQLNPSASGNNDKDIVSETIQEIASTQTFKNDKKPFKVIVIEEAENLSRTAQHALRRTMEKYTGNCRLILVAECINRIIDPLLSRCLCLRVPAPSEQQITAVLKDIARFEDFNPEENFIKEIVKTSGGNLRRCILAVEATFANKRPNESDVVVEKIGWEEFLKQVCLLICEEQSARRLIVVRSKIYVLLNNLIPADIILKEMTKNLVEKCDFKTQKKVYQWAAFHECRMRKGSKKIFHIEAFIAKFMCIYKDWKDEYFA